MYLAGLVALSGLWALREFFALRYRRAHHHALKQLALALESNQKQLQENCDDMFVLHRMLVEHGIFRQEEVNRAHNKWIQRPRQVAEMRHAVGKDVDDFAARLVMDDSDSKIH